MWFCRSRGGFGESEISRAVKIVTDSLGFRLEVAVIVEDMAGRGRHKTYEQNGMVTENVIHTIAINSNLRGDELTEVIAHEAYHLFFSVRHLIKVDEEAEAEVFGQLVKHIHTAASERRENSNGA